jgi:tetratricopeptide (TPR) repeat protein
MRTAIITFTLMFCFTAAFAQYNLYKGGVVEYNTGKFTEAITSLSAYLEKNTRDKKLDVEAYYARGMAHYKNSAYLKAIDDFNKTLTLSKTNAGNLYWLIGKCQSALNEHYHAIEFYTEALPFINQPKKQAQLLFDRAIAYKRIQQKDLAEADLKKALLLHPEHFLAQETLAEIVSTTNEALSKKSPDASGSKRIALIVGNSNYPASIGHLKNPVNDAMAMAAELKKLKFETVVKVNLTAAETKKTIRAFHALLKQTNPANTIGLFYYAGHGLQVEGTNYIIPVDVNIHEAKDIERLCIPMDAAFDAMQYADVKMSILILDACRNNPFPKTHQSVPKGLAPPNPVVGSFIGYATAPGSVASDGVAANGLYTQELIKVLRVPGLNIEQVFKKVRENVLTQSHGKQHTWDASNLVADFYFNK